MRSALVTVVVTIAAGLVAGCSAPEATVLDSRAPTGTPSRTIAESSPSPAEASTTISPSEADGAAALCSSSATDVLGAIENPTLTETSGLVASRSHPDVLWAHNDGPDGAGVYGLRSDGGDLGFHPLTGIDAVDVEDVAIVAGPTGDDLVLADIGDNALRRDTIRLYRFAEPDPDRPAPVESVQILEFTYPDGSHNAETLLVDQRNGRFVVVTKEQAPVDGQADPFGTTRPSFVFEGELDSSAAELRLAGILDTVALEAMNTDASHPASLLGFGGVPTGGDVAADGSLVAVRTYEAVWVWQRRPGQSVADALFEVPCQVRTVSERQGEAVAFLGDGLITLGEGAGTELHALGR